MFETIAVCLSIPFYIGDGKSPVYVNEDYLDKDNISTIITCYLALSQSNLQLIRLSRGQSPWTSVGFRAV